MLKRLVDGLFAAAGALAFSVLPSFIQQYLAGLAICRVELLRVVSDARLQPGAMSPDFLARTEARGEWCATAATAIDRSDGFGRLFAFARHFDMEIARATLGVFRPALQLTVDGLYLFYVGVIVGLIVSQLLASPFRLFSRRRRFRPARLP